MMAAVPTHDSTTDATNAGRSEPSPTVAAAAAACTNRHAEFYFTDEMTVFQVENRLFRVHRHFLAENSLIFSSMFSLPRDTSAELGSTPAEGTSDANPIYLSGVTELEFETLLRFFYKSIYDGFTLPQASWVALLSIAHRYEFLNVRERAIREIYGPFQARQNLKRWDSMTAEEVQNELQKHDYHLLISVAEKYDVPVCDLVPLLLPFVLREQPLTEGEVLRFSALTVSRLAHAREDFQRHGGSAMSIRKALEYAKEIVCRIWQVQKRVQKDDGQCNPQ